MSAFTWIPFYKELAVKLLVYRDRQDELIAVLKELKGRRRTGHQLERCASATGLLIKGLNFTKAGKYVFEVIGTTKAGNKITDVATLMVGN